ncbi:MAG TPA: hypothetical protein VLU25_12690 [Acidobacteriota bacterium]|nr:hypothetical protein [Acidobacteriota bacterium]
MAEKKAPTPETTIRIDAVRAAIWKRETRHGDRHHVTFNRLYKNGQKWGYARTYDRDDLLTLAKVADLAHSKIFELQQAQSKED